MIDSAQLINFFGWCSIINLAVLIISSLCIATMGNSISRLHGRLFDIDPERLRPVYFHYLGNYKIVTLVFNIAPYLALKIIA